MNRFCMFSWMYRDEAFCRQSAYALYTRLSAEMDSFPSGYSIELCLVNAYPGKGWLVSLLVPSCPPPITDLSDPLIKWLSKLGLLGEPELGTVEQQMTGESDMQRLLPDNARIINRASARSGMPSRYTPNASASISAVSKSNCFFCDAPASPADQLRMRFFTIDDYQKRSPSYGTKVISYSSRQNEIAIPRCGTCRLIHMVERISKTAAIFIGIIIVLLLLGVNWFLVIGFGLLLAFLSLIKDWMIKHLPSKWTRRLRRHAREHPEAKALLAMGWYEGDKPDPSVVKTGR